MKKKLTANNLRIIISLLLVSALICTSVSFSFAKSSEEEYEITSVSELTDVIEEALVDDNISRNEKSEILNEAKPEVIKEYVDDKINEALEALEKIPITLDEVRDGKAYQKETVDLGNGSEATIELFDAEDESLPQKLLGAITPSAYAASNGETLWKAYGNRYFTATFKTYVAPIGYADLRLENHYILSKNGIDENFGDSYIYVDIGLFTKVTPGKPKVTDSSARTPGASDVNMECKYTLSYSIGVDKVALNGSSTHKLYTTVSYLKHDTKNKKIQVKHKWSHT
jgi:hypothetical protein